MTEPDVTLTDYLLTLECGVICWLLWRRALARPALRAWTIVFFAATGAGALAGGTVHGFFLDESLTGYRILWPLTLLLLGVAALAVWNIGGRFWLGDGGAGWVSAAAGLAFLAYGAVVLFVSQGFIVAVVNYLPASLFLLVALVSAYRKRPSRPLIAGIVALLLTFASGALQQAGVGLHPVYFNHNALYHLLQAIALWLLYRCFRWISGESEGAVDRG